jgi:hypothetical protein
MYDEDMTEDDRDAEQDAAGQEARGQHHTVTLDVLVRIEVEALGADHETDDVYDMVTSEALSQGDIQNVEEV